ncbi:hypothetical protein ACFL6U_18180 [Planctomycetota bacterium]
MMYRILITCLLILILPTMLWAGETEIEVLQGTVHGHTQQTEMTIAAGKKVLLREGHEPIVAVNDPLVEKAIELYRWVEQERQAGYAEAEAEIVVFAIDDEQVMRSASITERINSGSETKSVLQLGPMSMFEDLKIYDFEGNLLDYEFKPVSEYAATYFIHLHKPVEPGQKIRYITVSPTIKHLFWQTQGPIWSTIFTNTSKANAKLFLYHTILPQSAILLSSFPDVLLTDEIEDRIALTFRQSIEPSNHMCFALSFLWPDKDGTTMDDVPPEMRGLRDREQERIIQEANKQWDRILDGQRFVDLSTPMNSLLSVISFIKHDLDKMEALGGILGLFIKNIYGGDLGYAKGQFAEAKKSLTHYQVYSYSSLPEAPKQGETAWVKLNHRGTFKPITVEFAHMGSGQWLFQGADFVTPLKSAADGSPMITDHQSLYTPTPQELTRGFVVVQGSGPEPHVRLNNLEVDLGRQERDLVPLTLAPLSEQGMVSIQVTGPGAKLCKVWVENDYQLHPGRQILLDVNSPNQFWLEVNSGNVDHGSYDLMVKLSSSQGSELKIPGTITVHDVTLPQRRTIRMKPFSCVVGLTGLDIHKPEIRKRLEVFLDDLALLRNTVCDWGYMYHPANVLHQVKITGTDQTLQVAGQAGFININNLPDLDFSFFDPWIVGSVKHGMTDLEISVHSTITEHERAFVKGVLGNNADDSDETCWTIIMWLYGQFRDYVHSRGITETWVGFNGLEPTDYVQTARRYQEIGYYTYLNNNGCAWNATRLNQLNAQSNAWYMSYWEMQTFLELTSQAWGYGKKQETVGTRWAPYENGGAVSTWWTPTPFFSAEIVDQVRDVVVSVNGKPLKYKQYYGRGNKERGVYMHWGPNLYVCLPDGGNPNEVKMQVNYTLRKPAQGKPAVQLDEGDQIWQAASGDYTLAYEKARAIAWRVCSDGTQGYSFWCYWLENPKYCIVWYDQESESMIHSRTWHGLRDGNEDAAYYYILQERLKAEGDQEGLMRLAALTGKIPNTPIRMTKARDPFGIVYRDIDQTNGYRQFNQAKREILKMLCSDR